MANHIVNSHFTVEGNPAAVKLPGPISWWPKKYDINKHGFLLDANAANAKEVYFLIIEGYEEVFREFRFFALSVNKLCLLPPDMIQYLVFM